MGDITGVTTAIIVTTRRLSASEGIFPGEPVVIPSSA